MLTGPEDTVGRAGAASPLPGPAVLTAARRGGLPVRLCPGGSQLGQLRLDIGHVPVGDRCGLRGWAVTVAAHVQSLPPGCPATG
jgi:hypothetical protein